MKKLVMKAPKQSKLIDVEMPTLKDENSVIVKLKYCGVCMSEHYDWEHAKDGMTFGHEGIGVVHQIGKNVTTVKVGDRVSGPIYGGAEYTCNDARNLIVIPDNIKDEEAVLEPLGCLISAVSKVKIPVVGDTVAVVGCGYMGCGAISLLKMRGARVIGFDIRKECLENALKYGASEVYTPEEYLKKNNSGFVATGTGTFGSNGGFPLVMEWGENNESLDFAINITATCGQLAIGAYHTGEKRSVDVQQLNVKAIDCLSTHPREWDLLLASCHNAINLMANDMWNYKHVPTKVYPVTKFDNAQGELTSKYGKWMKALIDWEHLDIEPYIIK